MTTAQIKQKTESKEVSTKLKSYNTEIARMKKEYLILKLSGPDDKENYKKIVEYSKEAKNLRLDFTKTHKDLKADALKVCNDLDSEKRRLIAEISEVEDHLNEQKNIVLEAEKRKKEEEQRLRQEAFDRKIQDVIEAGAVFDGSAYVYGDQRLTNNDIWMFSQDAFDMALKGIRLWKIGEEKRIESERQKRKEEAERQAKIAEEQKAEQDRLDKIKAEQAEEKRKLDEEKAAIESEKQRIAKEKEVAEAEKKAKAEAEEKAEREKKEAAELHEKQLKQAEQKRLDDIKATEEKAKADAEAKEQARLKAEAEEKERIEKERKAAERKARLAPDKDKIYAYANSLLAVPTPQLKEEESEKFFDSIHTQIVAQIAKLVEATQPK